MISVLLVSPTVGQQIFAFLDQGSVCSRIGQ
jgi:hypothetical protein